MKFQIRPILFVLAFTTIAQVQAMPVKTRPASIPFYLWTDPGNIFHVHKQEPKAAFYDYYQTEEFAYTEEGDFYTTDYYDIGINFTTPHTDNVIVKLVVTTHYYASYYQQTFYIPVAANVNSWVLRTLDMYRQDQYGQTIYYKVADIVDVYPA
jgi:hypothetical protein